MITNPLPGNKRRLSHLGELLNESLVKVSPRGPMVSKAATPGRPNGFAGLQYLNLIDGIWVAEDSSPQDINNEPPVKNPSGPFPF